MSSLSQTSKSMIWCSIFFQCGVKAKRNPSCAYCIYQSHQKWIPLGVFFFSPWPYLFHFYSIFSSPQSQTLSEGCGSLWIRWNHQLSGPFYLSGLLFKEISRLTPDQPQSPPSSSSCPIPSSCFPHGVGSHCCLCLSFALGAFIVVQTGFHSLSACTSSQWSLLNVCSRICVWVCVSVLV